MTTVAGSALPDSFMRRSNMPIGTTLLLIPVVLLAAFELARWRRAGIPLPRWVHGTAGSLFLLGAFISLIDIGVDAFSLREKLGMPLLYPLAVYVLFGLHGWRLRDSHRRDQSQDRDAAP